MLGGRAVRAALVVQRAEGDVMAGGGREVLRQSAEVRSVLLVLPVLLVLVIVGGLGLLIWRLSFVLFWWRTMGRLERR